jgi:CheY-like chemotaxis protein
LITDIRMPNMDGHELSRWFRDKQPDLPIVVVSSDKEQDFPLLSVHYSAVLMKPVGRKLLIGTVGELLKGSSIADVPRLPPLAATN